MSEQTPDTPDPSQGDTSEGKSTLSEHKGKLAIGVAATLGLIVYYKWRERRLAKEDPEAYARLQRLKASVRHDEPNSETAQEGTAPDPVYQSDQPLPHSEFKTPTK